MAEIFVNMYSYFDDDDNQTYFEWHFDNQTADFEDPGLETDFEDEDEDEVWEITKEDFENYRNELDKLYYDSIMIKTTEPISPPRSAYKSRSLSPNHRIRGFVNFVDWTLISPPSFT